MKARQLTFGEFRLDRANALLWRGTDRVLLAPKPFEVLCHLVEHAGELVTKDHLLDTVWAGLHVSESSLSVAMNALRAALGDDRQTPHYIETVPRRGYRFMAPVGVAETAALEAILAVDSPVTDEAVERRRAWRVGRAAALDGIDRALQKAMAGQRQVVFITGEAGIGKTTLVQMALERMQQNRLAVLHCACNELFGTREALLPLIEALHERCRGPDGAELLKSLRQLAPTWLAQMPGILGEDDRAGVQQEIFGATRERMLLEFADLMESLSTQRPWTIILEDLHWSDFATVDVLSRLARRDRRAAILVLATYRPMEVAVAGHPIRSVHEDLQIHGQSSEITLDRLSQTETERYLLLRFDSPALARDLAARIFARTAGQPLFVVSLVDHLVAEGAIVETAGQWRLGSVDATWRESLPRDLEGMILRQIDHLGTEERGLLEVASAAGAEFSALHVAGAQERTVLEVEQLCEDLVKAGRVIAGAGIAEWPNGAVSGRYTFQHALYQEILYQRLAPARRMNTHARLGASLERGYDAKAQEVAAALALHFEFGRDFSKAIHYLAAAAESSARRFSSRDAATYLSRALDLVPLLPESSRSVARLKLLLQRAWAWRACGDFVRSIEDLQAVVTHASENGLLREEVNALVDLSRFCLYVDRRQCLPYADQALAKSRAIDDPAFRALVQGNAANLRLMLRGWDKHDAEFCRRAAASMVGATDLSMRLRRCALNMVLAFLESDYQACCAATAEGKELTRVVGDVYLYVLYNTVEAFALLYSGEWGRLRRSVDSALAISERNVNPQASALGQITIGWLQAEALDFESAARSGQNALNAQVEANPFTFYVGRTLLARAHIGLHDLASARSHLDAIERRMALEQVPMESLVLPQYLLSLCDYFIATGDLEQAHNTAARLHEATCAAPDRSFLALAHWTLARIASSTGDTKAARHHLARAHAILRRAPLPLAAWRVYRATGDLHASLGESAKVDRWRQRAQAVIFALSASLAPDDPLRSAPLLAGHCAAQMS